MRMSYTLVILSWLCCSLVSADAIDPKHDYHSFANNHQAKTTHIDLDLTVDFDNKQLKGHVVLHFQRIQPSATELILDTRALTIEKVEANYGDNWKDTAFTLRDADPALGSALVITLPSNARKVKVHYSTSPTASGLQWLTPKQTAGKIHPFLFSQAQAINARSFIPLQDTPQVRVTYQATIRTPKALRAVMSAKNNPQAQLNGIHMFSMPQAIPSYLIALAVGDLHFKAMGKRTGVYAEKNILDAAANEFADTEAMLEATEAKFGPYSWGRYDLLILPPSFPFGGMENPRLSFITPTVIAGDKSLVALIAHELAHSWSGNSVTNATWRDLWLNEGFTTYLTYRTMEIIYGQRRFAMESVLGYQDLQATVKNIPANDQHLAIDVRGRDPDDAFSNIPYEKGALLLTEIEQKVGRPAFDKFLKTYFQRYAFTSVYTEEFLTYLDKNLVQQYPGKLSMKRIRQWVYQDGFPVDAPKPESDAFINVDKNRSLWLTGKQQAHQINTQQWTVHEWLYFLNNLPKKLTSKQLQQLDKAFSLTQSRNNEIAHSWLLIAINNNYQPAFERLEKYLISIGRRKLIKPLYAALVETSQGREFARKVYKKARPGYHPMAQNTMDKIVISDWDVSKPPGQWQSTRIDTDETTWSFVDISADGSTVIFDMLGDIYSVDAGGGKAKALTEGIAWNFQPRFSPDGAQIAFISDRDGADNIWVIDADGSNPRQVSKEKNNNLHNPYWTPDGNWIAARKGYISNRSIPAGSIWLYHAHGSEGVMLVDRLHGQNSQKNISEPSFSPDGRYLYYSQDITSGSVWQYNKNAIGSVFAVKRLDRQKGKTDTLISGPGGAIRPIPSPDGKQLAFIKRLPNMNSALYIKDLISGNEIPVYKQLDRDNQETAGTHGNYPAYAWTTDSSELIFWANGKIQRLNIASNKTRIIPISISANKKIRPALRYPVEVAPDQIDAKMLRWSQYNAAKTQVMFQSLGYIYTNNLSNKQPARLTKQQDHFEFWPSYSSDGKNVVYTTWNDQQLGSVNIVSAKGGKGRVITQTPGHYIEPRFSVDGTQILYRKISGGYLLSPTWSAKPGIYRASSKGGKTVLISSSGVNAHFSGDGSRIMFTDKGEKGQRELVSVNLNGKDKQVLAKGKNVTEFLVSPNGQWLAFTEQFNAYITPMPITDKPLDIHRTLKALPVKQVSKRSGHSLTWSPNSKALHWSNGPTLYTRELNDAFAFLQGSPKELPAPVEQGLTLTLTTTADKPKGISAIVGARIITMRGAEKQQEIIENGTIVIDKNRIIAIGKHDQIDIPNNAFVFNANGKTVIPGIIDVHAHGSMASQQITPQQNWMQYSNLAFGVTTIHDPSNNTQEVFAHSEMQRKGLVKGPRTFSTGKILYGALGADYQAVIESYEDALFHVQRLKDAGAISVKSYNQLRRDSRQQVIAAAEKLGIMVVPEGGMKFQHNMTHILDGHTGVEHALPIGKLYQDVVKFWSATNTGYTPTLGVCYGGIMGEVYWYDRTDVWKNTRLMRYSPRSIVEPIAMRRQKSPDQHYNHITVAKEAKKLRDAGVKVNLGAHGQREGLAAHWEIWMLHQGGFSAWEALRAATIDGAYYLGLDTDIGSLEVGKLADLAIIDGNPLDNIRISEYVSHTMINGRLYDTLSMKEIGTGNFSRQLFFFERKGGDTLPVATQQAMQEKAEKYHWKH